MRLLDEELVLACAAYVDLNPLRAALAETLETSDFTSVQRRIESLVQTAVVERELAFGRLFGVIAGQPNRIDKHRSRLHQRRYCIPRRTRQLLDPPQSYLGVAARFGSLVAFQPNPS